MSKTRSKKKSGSAAFTEKKFDLYQASVQCPEADVEFFKRVFFLHTNRAMRSLREDFCGTGALCAEWVRDHENHTAIGVDFDRPTLEWGRDHYLAVLNDEQRSRVDLRCEDVRNVVGTDVDLLCAQNFSYWIFQERQEMLRYFRIARDSLAEEGLFVCDMMGGSEVTSVEEVDRRIDDGERWDGSKMPPFNYIWDQNTYNPITGEMVCYIHFKLQRGKRMNKAFKYVWRVWQLPEIRDLLLEAGFSSVDVYTEGWDDEEEDTDGIFLKRKHFDHEGTWIAYLVAKP